MYVPTSYIMLLSYRVHIQLWIILIHAIDTIQLILNVSSNDVASDLTLLQYIRTKAELRGTKYNCLEGGCGACMVNVVKTNEDIVQAINSCMVTVASCHGWDITTIEKLGNKLDGYHQIQTTLAEYNGTQCGYCSPGWVMTMNSLLESNPDSTMAEVEQYFTGNICRCTGYRPIMDAFKSLAKDSPTFKLTDIEDLKICKKTGESCRKESCDSFDDWCIVGNKLKADENIHITFSDGKTWFRVSSVAAIRAVLKNINLDSYMLVHGNTAKGLYVITEYPNVMIDISAVQDLKGSSIDQNLVIGAGNTLAETITILKERVTEDYFKYLQKFIDHFTLIGNTGIRNLASLGGNLMIKHAHNEFASDIYVLIETVGGMVTIMDSHGISQAVNLSTFLTMDMKGKIIINIILPPYSENHHLVTYKIMPRSYNCAARVNAGFLYNVNAAGRVVSATIVYGSISSTFHHAHQTEAYLVGKALFTNTTLQSALAVLDTELVVDETNEVAKAAKKKIALGLFYKSLLTICPTNLMNSKYVSGATMLKTTRGVSQGQQTFVTNPSLYPLTEPLSKVEALIQCSGEAPYIDDTPALPREVFASFVLSTVGNGTIASIDASEALAMGGVLAFYSASDIPGENYFTTPIITPNVAYEEVLCNGTVKYHGQPIGIIVATTENVANRAATLVTVVYSNTTTPVINTRDAVNFTSRLTLYSSIEATNKGTDVTSTLTGKADLHEQYHFTMEKQTCITVPTDDGLEIMSATQWMDIVQVAVSKALAIDESRLDMKVRRVGGAFGAKISRASQIAVACSLVAYKLNRPCRMVLPLNTNMKAIGKRFACSANFEVAVNSYGVIQYVNLDMYEDNGYVVNESYYIFALDFLGNCYDATKWSVNGYDVITDKPSGTWMRAPGGLEMIAINEMIMEQISVTLGLDPVELRILNLSNTENDESNSSLVMINRLIVKSEYEKRKAEVTAYNEANRWKKRGLGFNPIKFPMITYCLYPCSVTVNHGDGSVVICHAGIEIGQGINTKAIQVCAYTLGISVDKIKTKAPNNIVNANSTPTSASLTSEYVCLGIIKCCEILKERFATLGGLPWEELVTAAYTNGLSLFASYHVSPADASVYHIFGACLTEVEMDILTGETQILRVDLFEDVGQSMNPQIDLGQIEGAFIKGMGYWMSEELSYDTTGELTTNRAWNYYVPLAKDIPQDFRVYFRENAYNTLGVLGSKTTGEPAICMSVSVPFAMRRALAASRADSGIAATTWFDIEGAYTVDKMVNAASAKLTEFIFT